MSNPDKYDIAVIGSGPGGYVAAIRGAQLGAKVAVIEKRELGGTCLNRGCIPIKTLLTSLNFERKTQTVQRLRKSLESLFKKNQIEIIKGTGVFKEPGIIEIIRQETGDRRQETIQTSKIILATGSEPLKPPQFKIDGKKIITSDEAFELKKAPKSILIVGAGAVGLHFAILFNQLGSRVTLIEMLPRILPGEDEELVKILERLLRGKAIKILTSTSIEKVIKEDKAVVITLSSGEELRGEMMLVAIGRKLNTEDLPVKKDGGKIIVNEKMEINFPDVYAVGDITGKALLAHVASAQGIIAAENAVGREVTIDYKALPRAYFTIPELASVGLTEKEASEKYQIKIGRFPFSASAKALIIGEREGLVKIISDAKTDEILGVHILGPQASSLIGEGSLAIKLKARTKDLADLMHAHPTLPEAVQEAAREKPIHL